MCVCVCVCVCVCTVAQIVFSEGVYSVMEGGEGYVEVCIALNGSLSLNSSSASGSFNLSTIPTTGLSAYMYIYTLITSLLIHTHKSLTLAHCVYIYTLLRVIY